MKARYFFAAAALACAGAWGCVDSNGTGGPVDAGPIVVNGPDASAPIVVIGNGNTAILDFGPIDCGGQAPAPKSFSLKNTGAQSVHYALSLSATSAFAIQGPASGDVAPGGTATATIAVNAVAQSATAGASDQATLTITTSDPALPSSTITLKRTARGGTLVVAPATVAIGDVPVTTTSQPESFKIQNTGNGAVSVAVGALSDAHFAISGASSPLAIAAAGSSSLTATFAPAAQGPASASAALTVTGATCGASATSVALSGNGVKGSVAVTPGALDFGSVNCGASAAAKSVTVRNSGSAPIHFQAALLAASSPYAVSPANGTVAAGQSATVTVTPDAIPQVSSTAPNGFGDTLRITSDVPGDGNHDVTLTETAQGAVLVLDKSTEPFGDTTIQSTASLPFTIANTGNAGATITLKASGAPFGVAPTAATALSANATPLAGTATFHPTALGAATPGSITIATGASDVICSAPIGPIALTGTGVNGTLTLSTKALDFKQVFCGQKAGPQSFTISNSGTGSFSWSAALGKGAGSPYALDVTSGTLAPGKGQVVNVTPAAIPFPSALTANLYGDTISITPTGISGGAAQQIALTETAKGGVVNASAASIPFPNTAQGQQSSAATLTLTNNGTSAVTLTPSITGTNASSFFLATPGATALAANGGNDSPGPTFKPQANGALTATVSLAVGGSDVLCQPLPSVTLTGTGTNGVLQVGAGSVALSQPCGKAAVTGTLKLTNNGNGALTFNAAILGSAGFQVAPTSGTLAAGGGNTTLTITSPTFATTLGNVNQVTDTLRITTNAFGDGNHDVGLSSTPNGAILAWGENGYAFNTVQATSGGTVSPQLGMSVINSGNAAATVSFSELSAGKTQYSFAPQNQSVNGGKTLNANVNFTPTHAGAQNDTVDMSVSAGTVLCAALPAGNALSGTGAVGAFSSATTALNFPLVCNAPASAQTFTINNTGSFAPVVVPYDFTASISGSGWLVSPTSGTIAAQKSATLTVTPPAEGSGTPGATNNVTVTVTTDIPGDTPHTFAMDGTVTGAALQFMSAAGAPETTHVMPSTNFPGNVTNDTTTLANSGSSATVGFPLIVPDAANPDYPSKAALKVTSTDPVNSGANTVQYQFTVPATAGCNTEVYTYTVTFPASTTSGVCSGATETVTITKNDTC